MKFDTPATRQSDRSAEGGRPADRPHRRPLKTTGTAPYAYERHDVVADQAYGYVVGAAIAKGRIAAIDLTRRKRGARRAGDRHGAECRQARQGRI